MLGAVGGKLMATFAGGGLAVVSGPNAQVLAPKVGRFVLKGVGGSSPDDLFLVSFDAASATEPLHVGKNDVVRMSSDPGFPPDVREFQVLDDGTVFARTNAGALYRRSASTALPTNTLPRPVYTATASIGGAPLNVGAAWGFTDGSTFHPAEYATVFVAAAPRAGKSTARPITFRGRIPLQPATPASGFCDSSSDIGVMLEADIAVAYQYCKYTFAQRSAAAVNVHFEGMLTVEGAPLAYAFDVSLELPK